MKKIVTLFLINTQLLCTSAQSLLKEARTALQQKDLSKTFALLQETQKLFPDNIEQFLISASAHYMAQDYPQSIACYEQFLSKNPRHISSRYNCATLYSKIGQFEKALQQYEKLYEHFKDDAVRTALLKLYIRSKQWKKAAAIITPKLWWYNANIASKIVLLDLAKDGNGFGDCIQFLRYAKILHQAGAKVIIVVPTALKTLCSYCPYIDSVLTQQDPKPSANLSFDICIVSFLLKLKNQIVMPVPQRPYLSIPQELEILWKNALAADTQFKIGICWQTSFARSRTTGELLPGPRSIPLELFAPFAQEGVSLYSLQKFEQPVKAPFPLLQFDKDFDESHGRFMDTAALILQMDLIISVDTSIVHLAGALGKKTWLILGCESDYRWFMNDTHSPLYPDVQIFRQTSYNSWEPVLAQLHTALQTLLLKV